MDALSTAQDTYLFQDADAAIDLKEDLIPLVQYFSDAIMYSQRLKVFGFVTVILQVFQFLKAVSSTVLPLFKLKLWSGLTTNAI
eukprot:SAG11_NODE_585_length_8349_cov_38.121939_6_plen_84_part_00